MLFYESEEQGIVLCIAPIFVPFDEASTNWSRINLLVSYCSRALAAPRFRPSWAVLGYVYTTEDLSTIAPVLWQQLLFVPLEVHWLCFVQKICQQLLPSSGGSYFLSLLRCCWLKRSVSKLLPSSVICSLPFISKIMTSFTFAFTCFYFHITFASFQGTFSCPFRSFPLWTSSKIVEQCISYGNIRAQTYHLMIIF